MTRKTLSLAMMSALAAASMALAPGAAHAQYDRGYGGGYEQVRHYQDDRGRGYRDRGGYDDRGGHYRRGYEGGRGGDYGRRRRCGNGTGGTIIGAIAGGLLGNAVAGYGDRAAGTIIGGGVGALAGNAIGRDC